MMRSAKKKEDEVRANRTAAKILPFLYYIEKGKQTKSTAVFVRVHFSFVFDSKGTNDNNIAS